MEIRSFDRVEVQDGDGLSCLTVMKSVEVIRNQGSSRLCAGEFGIPRQGLVICLTRDSVKPDAGPDEQSALS